MKKSELRKMVKEAFGSERSEERLRQLKLERLGKIQLDVQKISKNRVFKDQNLQKYFQIIDDTITKIFDAFGY